MALTYQQIIEISGFSGTVWETIKMPNYHYTRVYISESNAMKPEDTDIQPEEKKCQPASNLVTQLYYEQ